MPAGLVSALLVCLFNTVAWGQGASLLEFKQPSRLLDSQAGAWQSRSAVIVNNNDHARQVKVAYIGRSAGRKMIFGRIAEVPAKSSRRVDFLIQCGEPQKADDRTEPPKGITYTREDYLLTDAVTGQQLAVDYSSARMVDPQALAVLIAGDVPGGASDAKFKKVVLDSLGGGSYKDTVALSAQPPADRWSVLSLSRFVILGDINTAVLRQSQVQALEDFVRQGGTMLIAGHENSPGLLGGTVGRFAGVRGVGVHYSDAFGVAMAGEEKTARVSLDAPVPVVQMQAEDAQVLWTIDGLPLLTRRHIGQGQVYVLATPLHAMGAENATSVLNDVRKSALPPVDADKFTDPARQKLRSIEGRRGPARMVPAAMLFGIAGLVVIGGVFAKIKGRGELVWMALIPLAVLTGIGMYVYGATRGDTERLSHITLISGLGDGQARIDQVFTYCSGGDGRKVDFSTDSYRGTIRDLSQVSAVGSELEFLTEDRLIVPAQTVAPHSDRPFAVREIVSLKGISGDLTFGPGGLVGKLSNDLPMALEDSVIYVNRRSFKLGRIDASGSIAVEVASDDILPTDEFGTTLVRGQSDTIRTELINAILSRPEGFQQQVAANPIVLGYANGNPIATISRKKADQQGWCLVTWPLRIVPPDVGATVMVPAGFTDVRYSRGGYQRDSWANSGNASTDLFVSLPPQIKALDQARGSIEMRIKGANYVLTLFGMQNGQPVEIMSKANPNGQQRIDIPDVNRFRGSDGKYVFRISLKAVSESPDAGTSDFKVESIAVSLEGTSR